MRRRRGQLSSCIHVATITGHGNIYGGGGVYIQCLVGREACAIPRAFWGALADIAYVLFFIFPVALLITSTKTPFLSGNMSSRSCLCISRGQTSHRASCRDLVFTGFHRVHPAYDSVTGCRR